MTRSNCTIVWHGLANDAVPTAFQTESRFNKTTNKSVEISINNLSTCWLAIIKDKVN